MKGRMLEDQRFYYTHPWIGRADRPTDPILVPSWEAHFHFVHQRGEPTTNQRGTANENGNGNGSSGEERRGEMRGGMRGGGGQSWYLWPKVW